VDFVLRSAHEGLVGVLAQLVAIEDERLARVASAALRTLLAVVVVNDADARDRLVSHLEAKKYPIPDVLALTHVNSYRGPKRNDIPGFKGAGEDAQALTRAACAGADPPLPLSLPHHKGGKGKIDWPQGCLGHLCNLVRPAQRGHRATVIYGLLSGTLVFESLKDALEYREHVTQTLHLPCGAEMITLDMGRVSGRGIISGSNFRPPPLEKADFAVGSAASSFIESGHIEAMQSWLKVLRNKEEADAALAAAEKDFMCEEKRSRAELETLEAQLAEVDAELWRLRSPGGSISKMSKQRRGSRADEAPAEEEQTEDAEERHPTGRSKRRRIQKAG